MEKRYARQDAVNYAYKWAFSRNSNYYNYDNIGGDCTNFISQCIYAGSKIMNYTKTFGWYYKSANDKSPSWTGVEYLYNFLTRKDKSIGPIGKEATINDMEIGDIIQLSFDSNKFAHSLIITNIKDGNIFVTTHTFDALNKNLQLYTFKKIRFIHIEKVLY